MKNKVVIITGASSGIGLALAKEYASRGAKVVMAARQLEKMENAAYELKQANYDVHPVQTDVTSQDSCENLINQALEQYGKIDILINNAGISMRALFQDTEIDVLKQLMDVNFWGTVYCTKFALPHIIEQKGSIVGVISVAGHIGLPGRTGYSASKYAVRGFMDALRIENLHNGINVLVVAPGFTSSNIRSTALLGNGTEQGKSPRNESKMMSAETCAKIIIRATEKKKKELVLTLKSGKIPVLLGKWAPRLLDKLSYNQMAKEPNSPFKRRNA